MLTNLPPSVSRVSEQCGIFNTSQPYRSPRPVTGIAQCGILNTSHPYRSPRLYMLLTFVSRFIMECLPKSSKYHPCCPVGQDTLHIHRFLVSPRQYAARVVPSSLSALPGQASVWPSSSVCSPRSALITIGIAWPGECLALLVKFK
jgi:hypothetical protein